MSTDEKLKVICPICREQTLTEHCDVDTCRWTHCRNKRCDATLDGPKGIGHHANPDPDNPKRVRVWFDTEDKLWKERH